MNNAPKYGQDGLIGNQISFLTKSELDLIYQGALKHLRHNSIGLWNSVEVSNPKSLSGGGTLIIRVQNDGLYDDYTRENREDAGDLHSTGLIKLDVYKSIKVTYEIETLETDLMDSLTREQYVAMIRNGLTNRLAAYMDAHYIDIFVKYVKDHSDKLKDYQVLEIGKIIPHKLENINEQVELGKKLILALSDMQYALASKIDRRDIGASESDFATLLDKMVTNRVLLGMRAAGDSATEISRNLSGLDGMTQIAGLNGLVKNHLFFNKHIKKEILHKTDEFNFENVYGVMAHRDAALLAQGGMQISETRLRSGNPHYILKFNLWRGIIRPDLFGIICSKKDEIIGSNLKDLPEIKTSENLKDFPNDKQDQDEKNDKITGPYIKKKI